MSRQRWRAPKLVQTRARELRRNMTPAEKKLWQRIRFGQLGAHFRRQHAIGKYIVDFICVKSKLVIEVDGDNHAEQTKYDEKRTKWLSEQKDYRVIRFWNNEVLHNIEGVITIIIEELDGSANYNHARTNICRSDP